MGPEDRGWVAIGTSPVLSDVFPEGWIESFAREAKVAVRNTWRMDSISQRGAVVFAPDAQDWQTIELFHEGSLGEHNAELKEEYALPEYFLWRFNYLGSDMATPGLDVEDMNDAWCLARAKSGDIKDLTALAEWRPALAWLALGG